LRRPKYLSPTSYSLAKRNMEDFYLRYLSDHRPPRSAQTEPMAIGSAFDAYVKSYLHEKLFGPTPEYELRKLFDEQVEPQHRDWAWTSGQVAFNMYQQSGALADLLIELHKAVGTPVFEVSIQGVVHVPNIGEVSLLGKPDIYFINGKGTPVILDWKVNGWFSWRGASPKRGYMKLRHGSLTRSLDKDHHRDCHPMLVDGMMINAGHPLDVVDPSWAAQVSVYAWLCGADVGSNFITAIDQLACKPSQGKYPDVRIAEHRARVGKQFQVDTFTKLVELWEIVNSDHIFREMTPRDSKLLCETLDDQSKLMYQIHESGDDEDRDFLELSK
jgi:hypothetical protein